MKLAVLDGGPADGAVLGLPTPYFPANLETTHPIPARYRCAWALANGAAALYIPAQPPEGATP